MTPQTFIFIGRSGCGKGTQSELLQKLIKQKDPQSEIFYLEAGERFRQFIKGDGSTNKISADIYKKGERQPAFLAIWVWSNLLIENFKTTEHAFFDGITRSLPEAITFTTALKFYNRKATVIHLDVSREWSEERLLARGRMDDQSIEDIRKRLDWFDKDSRPAVDYFRTDPIYTVLDINGMQTIEEVHNEIVRKLEW